MAASNWAQMCFNRDGSPSDTSIEGHNHVVKFYKNWVYLTKSGQDDVMMTVNSGEGVIGAWCWCLARLESQDGIAGALWYDDYSDPNNVVRGGIFGIGVYAFDEEDYVGMKKETLDEVKELLNRMGKEGFYSYRGNEKTYHEYENHIGPFRNIPDDFRKIDFDNGVYYNQGDIFFGITEGTKVGEEAPTPVLMTIIDDMNDVKEENHSGI